MAPLVLGLVGIALVAVGAAKLLAARRAASSGLRAAGVVVGLVTGRPGGPETGSGLSFPVVRYRTGEGLQVTFTASQGARPAAHHPGEQVTVVYDPLRPDRARIAGPQGMLLYGCLLAVGVLLLLAGAASFLLVGWLQG
jgi:Protein of unknown function (DUF3592)